jgi:hypothetical protein
LRVVPIRRRRFTTLKCVERAARCAQDGQIAHAQSYEDRDRTKSAHEFSELAVDKTGLLNY